MTSTISYDNVTTGTKVRASRTLAVSFDSPLYITIMPPQRKRKRRQGKTDDQSSLSPSKVSKQVQGPKPSTTAEATSDMAPTTATVASNVSRSITVTDTNVADTTTAQSGVESSTVEATNEAEFVEAPDTIIVDDGDAAVHVRNDGSYGYHADPLDVLGILLGGEKDDGVPVYDTCDDVREKIQSHLDQTSVKKTAFLREIAKTYRDPRSIQTVQLSNFLRQQGATRGNTSAVYYASYVYFEKLRIKKREPKTGKREIMESLHPFGIDTKKVTTNISYVVVGDVNVYEDEYGTVFCQ